MRKRVVEVRAQEKPVEERRAVLRGLAAGAVVTGVQLFGNAESALAIQTRTTPRPFTLDYERWKDRAGSYLGPEQMARIRMEFKDTVRVFARFLDRHNPACIYKEQEACSLKRFRFVFGFLPF